MAKVRVYELAKELGVESKTVLTTLGDMGEFVRSASSTVEAPVVRRLRGEAGERAAAGQEDRQEGCGRQVAEAPAARRLPARRPRPRRPLSRRPRPPRRRRPPRRATPPTRSRPRPPTPRAGDARAAAARPDPYAGPASRCAARARPAAAAAPPRTGETPGNGQAQPGPRPRPGSTGGLPGWRSRARRPGTPRPGNNPFSASQGMGRPRTPRPGDRGGRRPGGPRPPAGRAPGCPAAVPACRACPGPTRR